MPGFDPIEKGMGTSEKTDRRVGLVELDDLAPMLEDAGFETISGSTLAAAAKRITEEWANGQFPILVADSSNPKLYKWIVQVATHKSRPAVTVITDSGEPEHISHDAIAVQKTPTTLGELAETAKLGDIDSGHAGLTYPASGEDEDPSADEGLPSFSDDDDWDDEPADTPAPGTAAPASAPEPAAPQVDDDGWDDEPEAPAHPEPTPAPAAVEPTPAAVTQPQTPAPAAAPAPAADDPYEQGLFNVAPEPTAEVDDADGNDEDLDTLFTVAGSSRARRCPVIICLSGTGGVGKSTASIQLATAAASAGYRTVLVDADRGQGDLDTYLKLSTSGLDVPTIADTVGGHAKVRDVVLGSDKITQLRPKNAEVVPDMLAFVRTPDPDDPTKVSPKRYLSVINQLREKADIVIVDSPILKHDDHTGVIRGLVAPLMEDGGFSLSISDNSNPGMKNLSQRLSALSAHGIERRKMLITINAADPSALRDLDAAARTKLDGRQGVYVGTIGYDKRIGRKMRNGALDLKNRQLDQVIYETLFRATGAEVFDLDFGIEHSNADDDAPKVSFLARLFGRK